MSYPPVTDSEAMFRIPGIKIFSDGGSCNSGAYSWRQPPGAGMYFTVEELAAVVVEVQELGYQAQIHTLGDVAVETALEAFETALGGGPNTYSVLMTMVGGEVEHCMPGHEALCPSDGP